MPKLNDKFHVMSKLTDVNNELIAGGKHYGFLEVEVRPSGDYNYEVIMTPRYVFPITDKTGSSTGEFDQRQ